MVHHLETLLFLILNSVGGGICISRDEGPTGVLDTPLGKVSGYEMHSRAGRRFFAFSGLPYAKPPTKELSFMPPEPVEPWTGVFNATIDGPLCLQLNTFTLHLDPMGEEDCLYLSLYTHLGSVKSPVLVHFHGGGFSAGNGARLTGPQYFMDHDIIVVNVNYRLSAYGFLSFEDEEMPGNLGLKDQVMALRWVKNNIASFGGDPNRVTIIGESSGAVSVYLHMISPLSLGLFDRVIAESGSSYNSWAVAPPGFARNKTLVLLSHLGCSINTTKEGVECLRQKNPMEVLSALKIFREWQVDPLIFLTPVYEPPGPNAFLAKPISSWQPKPVPLLIGMDSAEGLVRSIYFLLSSMDFKWYSEHFNEVVPLSLGIYVLSKNQDELTEKIRNYYFPNHDISEKDWVNITNMYSDALLNVGVLDGANKHTGKAFFYYFDYLGKQSFAGNSKSRNDSLIFGSYHTDETLYLWKTTGYGDPEGKDLFISKKLVKMWVNFATNGKPGDNNTEWFPWTSKKHNYFHISKDGMKMKEGLLENRYKFWKNLL